MVEPAVRLAECFVDEVVRPSIREWDRAAVYPREAVGASGLTGIFAPEDLGGLELSFLDAVDVFEALGRGDAALAFSISMHNAVTSAVARAGDDDLKATWGRKLVSGEALGGFCLTEPQAGSDATAITTLARQDGDGWRVSGRKAWSTLGGVADVYTVVAKTTEEPGHADIAILVVERDAEGVRFGEPYEKACADFLPITDVELTDAPARMLVPPGHGMRATLGAIDVGRFDVAAISNGQHAESLDVATRYALQRKVFGKPILEHQGMAWALADSATELQAARGLTRYAAEALGTPGSTVAIAHAKKFGPEVALRAAILCSETLGAYGSRRDYPFARFIANAKMLQVIDGTSEVLRIIIARDLLRRASG